MLPVTVNTRDGRAIEITDENLAGFYTPSVERESNLLAEFLFPSLYRRHFMAVAAYLPVTLILRDPDTGALQHVQIIEPLGELNRRLVESSRLEDFLRGREPREPRMPPGPLFVYPYRGPDRYL